MKRVALQAPAKINLFLEVRGRRTDGYHDIRSVVTPVSLWDSMVLESVPGGIELVSDPHVWFKGVPWPLTLGRADDNLAVRAARLFKSWTGCRCGGVRIRLKKRIPVGGGLGGGSADAAAVLLGLNRLWGTNLSASELMAMGARLGCDVPALVAAAPALMEGRGEIITPLQKVRPNLALWLVLVYPGFSVSTGDVYQRCDRDLTIRPANTKFTAILDGLESGRKYRIADGLFNTLERTVFRKYPVLKIIKNVLEKAGSPGVLLSGSGSTVFALTSSQDQGNRLIRRVRAEVGLPLWMATVRAML